MTPPILLALILALATPGAGDGAVDYPRDVKPLLTKRCYACHGAQAEVGAAARHGRADPQGGRKRPGGRARQGDESLLIEAITGRRAGGCRRRGTPLSPDEIGLIRLDRPGGPRSRRRAPQADPRDHWAFRPPVRPAVPAGSRASGARNPIDAFLAAEHRSAVG